MREFLSSITRKGQVTIPAEIRRLLGVAPHDKVAFLVEDGQIRLAHAGSVVARTAGAIKIEGPPREAKVLREVAEGSIAQEAVERMVG